MRYFILVFLCSLMMFTSCTTPDPNADKQGRDELKSLELDREIDESEMRFSDILYVPVYSDIYFDLQNQKNLLSSTLSIRNTSFKDSLFIETIDYYNTEGSLVRKYLEKPISLPSMGTVNYVVEKEDDTGGPGANFIVNLSSRSKDVKPLIQAIMVGHNGNKGFAFATDAYSIK